MAINGLGCASTKTTDAPAMIPASVKGWTRSRWPVPCEASIATGEAVRIELAVSDVSRKLQSRIDRCSAIINGHTEKLNQSAVDELFD